MRLARPGFVRGIQVDATHSRIKISWSLPTANTDAVISDFHYYIYYLYVLKEIDGVTETLETQFELSSLEPHTYIFFAINAVYQEISGPQVFIGISTGNVQVFGRTYTV